MPKKRPTADEMLVRMAGLCAGAEQCAADIRNKILKQGFSAHEADRMILYLKKNSYLDDSRYAHAYAVDKVRFSGWGRMKIRMGLRAKGMEDSFIAQALASIPEEYYIEALHKALSAKTRSLDLSEVNDRQKLYRHLVARGFESQLIISAIRRHMVEKTE